MGEYNYSPWLLDANKELVAYLLQLAKDGEQAKSVFDTAEAARRYRLKILEILANLVRNHPDQAPLRARIRTFIKYEGERYAVYVGVPRADQKLRGAKPQLPAGVTAEASVYGTELRITDEITDTNFSAIQLQLGMAKALVQEHKNEAPDHIIITHVPSPDGIRYLTEFLEPEYNLLQRSPHLLYERQHTNVDASAIIASAHAEKKP